MHFLPLTCRCCCDSRLCICASASILWISESSITASCFPIIYPFSVCFASLFSTLSLRISYIFSDLSCFRIEYPRASLFSLLCFSILSDLFMITLPLGWCVKLKHLRKKGKVKGLRTRSRRYGKREGIPRRPDPHSYTGITREGGKDHNEGLVRESVWERLYE